MLRKRNNRWYNYFYFHSKSQEIYKTTTKIDELNTRFMVNVQKSIVFYPQVADKKNMKFNTQSHLTVVKHEWARNKSNLTNGCPRPPCCNARALPREELKAWASRDTYHVHGLENSSVVANLSKCPTDSIQFLNQLCKDQQADSKIYMEMQRRWNNQSNI